jgi:hypothetical protein
MPAPPLRRLAALLAAAAAVARCCALDTTAARARAGGEELVQALAERRADDALRLIASGAQPGFADARGFTPLQVASYTCGDAALRGVARALLDAGADASAASAGGTSPLLAACAAGDEELALTLLARGADAAAAAGGAFTSGLGALDVCAIMGLGRAAAALRAAGAAASAAAAALGPRRAACRVLLWACRDGCDSAALRLLRGGGDGGDGGNGAAAGGNASAPVPALGAGAGAEAVPAEPAFDCSDDSGLTPLHWAVNNGAEAVVRALHERGADALARDDRGLTPLAMVESVEDAGVRARLGPLLARVRGKAGAEQAATPPSGEALEL